MFKVQVLDSYGETESNYFYHTLEDALEQARRYVLEGISKDNIKMYHELELVFTIDVQVKVD